MKSGRLTISTFLASLVLGLVASATWAVPVKVSHEDLPECDVLWVPEHVDELGIGQNTAVPGTVGGPFPPDEEIAAFGEEIARPACSATDNPAMPNKVLSITNLTSPARSFKELWYVGNPNTYLSNLDGLVYQQGAEDLGYGLAFRIDTIGSNRPLIGETGVANGIFEPGETWKLVVQDFVSGGPTPGVADLASIGVAGGSLLGGDSSGSIIGVPVPEPSTLILLAVGMVWPVISCCRRGRRQRLTTVMPQL